MHPLDNVIWQALTTRQTQFAEVRGQARRFQREVTLLSAFQEPSENGYEDLATLAAAGGTLAIFLEKPYEARAGWNFVAGAPLLEMVCENGKATHAAGGSAAEIVPLRPEDSPEMMALAVLTRPGPFASRTHELGTYLGIRQQGKLVAMAGERLKVPGYTEVSAVCTHPEHTGRGYAALLMMEIMRGIRERGETPFLHVRQDNARAVALYERLGFQTLKTLHFAVLRKISSEKTNGGANAAIESHR